MSEAQAYIGSPLKGFEYLGDVSNVHLDLGPRQVDDLNWSLYSSVSTQVSVTLNATLGPGWHGLHMAFHLEETLRIPFMDAWDQASEWVSAPSWVRPIIRLQYGSRLLHRWIDPRGGLYGKPTVFYRWLRWKVRLLRFPNEPAA